MNPKRSQSFYRQYDDSTMERIKFIENVKLLGFKLNEIKELFLLGGENLSSLEVKQKVALNFAERTVSIEGCLETQAPWLPCARYITRKYKTCLFRSSINYYCIIECRCISREQSKRLDFTSN